MARIRPSIGVRIGSEPHLEGLAALHAAAERVEFVVHEPAVRAFASNHADCMIRRGILVSVQVVKLGVLLLRIGCSGVYESWAKMAVG